MQAPASTAQPQPSCQRTVLGNGMALLVAPNPVADIVAGCLFVRHAGARGEPRERAGTANLLSAVLTKGSERQSAAAIAERVESMGAELEADAAPDYLLLSFKAVSADWAALLRLLAEIARAPSLPEAEIELERNVALQDLRQAREQPASVALEGLQAGLYPHHPYGVSVLGTEASVAALTRADLQRHHQTFFRPDNITLSLAGNLDAEGAIATANEVLGDWQPPQAPLPTPQLPAPVPQSGQTATEQASQQAFVMLGYLAPSVRDADYPALKLLSSYLGNGLSSRLFVELREKRGLAYEVSAFYPTRWDPAPFVAYMGTAPQNAATALAGLQQEIERACSHPVSESTLAAAQSQLLGQYALGKQSNAQLAQLYGWYDALGVGAAFDRQLQQAVAAVTPEALQAVARRYLQGKPYVSLVGPGEAIARCEG